MHQHPGSSRVRSWAASLRPWRVWHRSGCPVRCGPSTPSPGTRAPHLCNTFRKFSKHYRAFVLTRTTHFLHYVVFPGRSETAGAACTSFLRAAAYVGDVREACVCGTHHVPVSTRPRPARWGGTGAAGLPPGLHPICTSGEGKTYASRQGGLGGLFHQGVAKKKRHSTGLLPLRRKVTDATPPWWVGRGISGQSRPMPPRLEVQPTSHPPRHGFQREVFMLKRCG